MEQDTEILKEVQTVKKEYTLEKHIQTILLSVITVSIIGGFNKITSISESLVRLEEREKVKAEQVGALQIIANKNQLDIQLIKERLYQIENKRAQ